MLSHEGIPLRRILPVTRGRFLIERKDRATFVVQLDAIGADDGVDEVLKTARNKAGKILEDSLGTKATHEA